MRRLIAALGLTAALLGGAGGCVFRTIPLPPPGATASTQSCTADLGCPSDGVIVTVRGLAQPSAIVIAENVTRHFSDGRRYSAQAFAASGAIDDGGAVPGGPGTYELVLGPLPDPAGTPLLSRHGDQIAVFQLVRNSEGAFEMSSVGFITVP